MPITFAIAARPRTSTTNATPVMTTAVSLAETMRRLLGSRVNVTRPVRCDHSLVTARMPSTGSRKPCGVAAIPTKLS